MRRGYVKLWRKGLDSGLMQNHEAWAVWTYILLRASHKPHSQLVGTQIVNLSPGQLVVGRKSLADRLGLTERKVRTCLLLLKKMKNVTIQTTNRFSLVTVVNWELYQGDDQQTTNEATSKRPANDQQTTTNKNEEHVEEKKKTPPLIAPPTGGNPVYSKSFESFWASYPRRVGKIAAFKAWKRIGKRGGVSATDLIKAVEAQVAANHFQSEDGKLCVPNPSTWLNQGRWMDELAGLNSGQNRKALEDWAKEEEAVA